MAATARTTRLPVAVDSLDEPFELEWRGQAFVIPPPKKWRPKIFLALDRKQYMEVLAQLLGEEQFDAWDAAWDDGAEVSDMEEFLNKIMAAAGIGSAGESPASSD